MKNYILAIGYALCSMTGLYAQTNIAELIARYQEDPRGPYRDIRWFCADGEVREPRDPCPDTHPDNRQHARYKAEVIQLGEREHIFLGQILAATPPRAFLDRSNDFSRLKQYQLGNYLAAVDDGWVLRKAQFYRGAVQIEDERAWGRDFLSSTLRDSELLRTHYYLLRQAVRDIPHGEETDLTVKIRADSKTIADAFPAFMDLRIKIHGQPEGEDADAVTDFLANHRPELERKGLVEKTEQLIADIRTEYARQDLVAEIGKYQAVLTDGPVKQKLANFVTQHAYRPADPAHEDRLTAAADLLLALREAIATAAANDRLPLMDISLLLEKIVFTTAGTWQPRTIDELTEKICYLSTAATGAGFAERWEWQQAAPALGDMNYRKVWPWMLDEYLDHARRFVEWGTATNRTTYGDVVARYASFEPKAYGFLDDRIRGSVLLPLGNAVGKLGNWVALVGNLNNALLDVPNQGQLRGLNPGYALGRLHVVADEAALPEVNPRDIYVFGRPPADLKPVGGIATVSEGNMVSHVQLLARNLGIPNAVLTAEQFQALQAYDGKEVFYAVSNGGTIIMKESAQMDAEEKALFTQKTRSTDRISVPVEDIRLEVRRLLNMREVRSKDSGKLCGPKAANLGQLKAMFPDKVVEGLVIPFGIFRSHLDQPMPGQENLSYWDFLNDRFRKIREMENNGIAPAAVDVYALEQLATLREAIGQIQIQPELVRSLRDSFRVIFGGALGEVPVFLRSDTNMEDLPDFTGAGLNKTVFNVVAEEKIMAGIRDVWASPYTERSYKWRQQYLLNPENVFPSILIIPSVDVENSGVMITKGIVSGKADDITAAFSRGAGGAVDGQAAEAYLLRADGTNTLLSPARERLHRRLPASGGSVMLPAAFDERILSPDNLRDLRKLAREVARVMPEAPGINTTGPWDIELGFQNDRIFLFQIRPFVENKRAQSSEYLQRISPPPIKDVYFDLEADLQAVLE